MKTFKELKEQYAKCSTMDELTALMGEWDKVRVHSGKRMGELSELIDPLLIEKSELQDDWISTGQHMDGWIRDRAAKLLFPNKMAQVTEPSNWKISSV